ncbi:MAG: threonine synthase [Fimbriimonadaceae bacterium]|nr:threonine synthase [Alphaproteobacteria bacterium]
MRYISTRGESSDLTFEEVSLAGLARDGGLYVPSSWPELNAAQISALGPMSYAQSAVEILRPFVTGSLSDAELAQFCDSAYATFTTPEVAPLKQVGDNDWVLELFHGPTSAFKDVAMQFLSRLIDHFLTRRGKRVTIIGATSGDTGAAAVQAFRGLKSVDVFMLHPNGRVSDVQRRQMTTILDDNIHNIALDGTFDDCQTIVKTLFQDLEFRDRYALSGVNSINWARVVAQAVYYFTAAVSLGAPRREVAFSVPTGNFGDVYAGYIAKKMGLPIARLMIATNVNDILVRTLASGRYELHKVVATQSPSMDIQIASNFERLLFDVLDRDSVKMRNLMSDLNNKGGFELNEEPLNRIREIFAAGKSDEALTRATIASVYREGDYIIDPHTAVGLAVARDKRKSGEVAPDCPLVSLSTAHPAKFPDAIFDAIGVRPQLPDHMSDLFARKECYSVLPSDAGAVAKFVADRASVTGVGA